MSVAFRNWASGALSEAAWAPNAWNTNITVAPTAASMGMTGFVSGLGSIGTVWATGALAGASWVTGAWANATQAIAPAAATLTMTGATPSLSQTTYVWFSLPAPGTYDSNSIIYGQTYPTGSWIREVTPPAHISATNYAIGPLQNDINDYMVAVTGYTGSDSGVYEIKTPAGATSQYTITFAIGSVTVTVSPSAASMAMTGGTPGVTTGQPALTPAAAHLTMTGGTPNVIAPQNVILSPAAASMTMTGATPDTQVSHCGNSLGSAVLNGASSMSDDADYALLAANDLRTFIQKVPGSGPIRGVWVYNDKVYAFRDNVGATAGLMYVSSAGGWVLIIMPYELQFNTGVGAIAVGDTVTNGTASGVVAAVLIRTGSWANSNAVGSLILSSLTGGTFATSDAIKIGATTKATAAAGLTSRYVRAPGGKMEFVNYNFTGSTLTKKMYGCDGVNLAFEFNGTLYVPIRTGMVVDAPSHIYAHRLYLFLSFNGSVQYSNLGDPYGWTVILGAGEIGVGEDVTGFLASGGTAAGSALSIFTSGKVHTLYGSSAASFQLVQSNFDMGMSPFTAQIVGNNVYGLTARGIQSLITTLTYGDFDYISVSHPIQPIMDSRRGLEISSTTLKSKNQYRLYFSDGTGIVVGLTGEKISGLMPLNYNRPVRCMCTANLSTGQEVTYFGSDDGYIYQDNIGTSFDGAAVESWCRTQFNNEKSPYVRKSYKRAVLEAKVERYCQVNISYDLGYGDPAVLPSPLLADRQLSGPGGYWDEVYWDTFTWDTKSIVNPQIPLNGTEKNLSLLFYSNRAQDYPHLLQGVNLLFIPRRIERA